MAALLALLTVAFYWRLVLTDQYTWMNSPDLARQVLPWYQFQAGEIQNGRIPLWDPYVYGGQPLLAQTQPGLAYPLNWLLFLLPTHNGWIQLTWLHWYFVLIHFMAVAFAYLLCRDVELSRMASVCGAMLYGLSGFMAFNHWPQMLNGAVWIPLVLLFVLRIERGYRPWAAAGAGGAALGMAMLSGHHQVPLYTALMAAFLLAWIAVRRGWLGAAQGGVMFAVAGLVSALQTLPALEYSKLAHRWVSAAVPVGPGDVVPYRVHEMFSHTAEHLWGILVPVVDGRLMYYAGVSGAALAVSGLLLGWRKPVVRIAFAIWAAGVLFSMGGSTPLHGLLYSIIPVLEKARTPAMGAALAHAGLCVLAATGVDALLAARTARFTRMLAGTLAACGAAVYAAWFGIRMVGAGSFPPDTVFAALVALVFAGLLAAWRRQALQPGLAFTLLALTVWVELGHNLPYPHREQGFAELAKVPKLHGVVEAVRKEAPWGRVHFWNAEQTLGDFFGIEAFHGYLASLTSNVEPVLRSEEAWLRYGVRYLVKPEPHLGWDQLVDQTDDWTLWRNPDARGPVWIEHAGVCPEDDAAFLLRRESNRVVIWTDMACPGKLVVADTYYPGWQVRVNGQPGTIEPVHESLRAVTLAAGKHRVEMRYRPLSVYLGAGLTLLGLLIAGCLQRFPR